MFYLFYNRHDRILEKFTSKEGLIEFINEEYNEFTEEELKDIIKIYEVNEEINFTFKKSFNFDFK